MLRWNNDYSQGAHPAILAALTRTNTESYGGYGQDIWCDRAAARIRALLEKEEAAVHFLMGGTQANFTVISAALRPYQGVVCPDSGHIHVHETGAVEHTGHKIHPLPARNGLLTAGQIAAEAERYRASEIPEHLTQPKLVYLSYPTEFGTLYSRAELEAIHGVCREYGLYLFIDGARLGYGLGSPASDVTLPDLARLADAFTLGGTKCGCLFGEAVILLHDDLKPGFRSCMKQSGAMLAKGWLLGLQFSTLLEDGLYFSITRQAVEQAMEIRQAFREAGIPFLLDSPTNQQFVILTREQARSLGREHLYELQENLPDGRICARFCTSWATREEDVETLCRDILALA